MFLEPMIDFRLRLQCDLFQMFIVPARMEKQPAVPPG